MLTLPYKSRVLLLPVLSLIVLVVMSGEAMLTAALPSITHEFEAPGVFSSWVLPMVLLVGAAGAPFIGTAGDRYGRRRLLIICMFLYLIGLILGFLSWDLISLLFSRALQGVGIASFPLAYALVRDQLPPRESDVGIGILSAMYGAGMFIGVIIGSFLTELFSWRITYLTLIPAIVILLLLTFLIIQKSASDLVIPLHSPDQGLDWPGFLCLLITLLLGLTTMSLNDPGPTESTLRIIAGGGAILAGIFFVRRELTIPSPLVDLRMAIQRPAFLLISAGSLTILMSFVLLQEMPFLIQSPTGLGLTAGYVGLVLMPGTLCDMISGPITGRYVLSRGVRPACILGSVFLLVSSFLLLSGIPSLLMLTVIWMIFSAGMSVTTTACIIAFIDFVPSSRTAEATGLVQSVQTIGGMVGPVITGLILTESSVTTLRNGVIWEYPASFTFVQVHEIALVLGILVLVCSCMIHNHNPEGFRS